MSVTVDPDQERGLYGKYRVEKVNGKPVGRAFVLAYDNDPHARVALEAYADSCADDFPELAADLYRALGIEVCTAQVDISTSLSQYLGDHYRGKWVAIRKGGVVAAGDTLREAKERSDSSDDPRMLAYVPREGESQHG